MSDIELRNSLLKQLDEINRLSQIPGQESQAQEAKVKFEDVLKNFVNDVNDMQLMAKESIEKLAAGEITDVHQVMVAVEKAGVSFDLMMEIRNKMLEAYQEIMRMQV
ncbi:MAG: flagellar hook-basal body complex protein FliE [Candidatus Delongbacteria bacterium]|nr:flagellar hook-basal body complex protein FliE [Candidatus Delongbacteria bacterium]